METPGFLRAPLTLARKAWAHPWVALGCVALLLLIAAWVAWAVHVGSKNGTDAAVGVLISWPLLFVLAANVVLLVVGIRRLARRDGGPRAMQGREGSVTSSQEDDEPASEAAPEDAATKAG